MAATTPITSSTLRAIADALDQLAQVSAHVSTVDIHGLHVTIRRHSGSQRDGAWYELVGWVQAGERDDRGGA